MTLRDRIADVLAAHDGLAMDNEPEREKLLGALLSALDQGFADLVLEATKRALGNGRPVLAEMAALFREQAAQPKQRRAAPCSDPACELCAVLAPATGPETDA